MPRFDTIENRKDEIEILQKRSCPFGGVVRFRFFRGITVLRR
jgi:hypothetical protein